MTKITISTRVPPELATRISQSGYSISDVIWASVEMFLALPAVRQDSIISAHLWNKKRNRIYRRFSNRLG